MHRKEFLAAQQVGDGRPGLIALHRWVEQAGITPVTAWRFRKRGWLETVNIAGRQYVTLQEIARFTARAAAGEFAAPHPTPSRPSTRTTGAEAA